MHSPHGGCARYVVAEERAKDWTRMSRGAALSNCLEDCPGVDKAPRLEKIASIGDGEYRFRDGRELV